jgi:mono/diheme cytochrome c family protein
MKWLVRTLITLAFLIIAVLIWANRHAEIASIAPGSMPVASKDLLDQGEMLATLGGCESCHGKDLAGGVRLPTPFGALYSTNITPDPQTGIGAWSPDAFRRAMRRGIDRAGGYLYPAFPYDHFTKTTDDDIDAIYAYLMSRPAITRTETPNELTFPYNIRLSMAAWNLLFLDEGAFVPDPTQNDTWNRGAYLAEGLGHCAACHTPRNFLGARDHAREYSGGDAEGWHSPALNAASPAPIQWTMESLINYFFDGWDGEHGIAAGPMKDVVEHVSTLSEEDVDALATFVLSLRGPVPNTDATAALDFSKEAAIGITGAEVKLAETANPDGAKVFKDRCVNCHRAGSETIPLALTSAVWGPDPTNLLKVVVQGVTPTENAYFVRPMPGFPTLTDKELEELAVFVRSNFSTEAEWENLETAIGAVRP